MKTVVTIILSVSILFNYINVEDLDTGAKQNELTAMIDVATKNEMKIQTWTIYSRENIGYVKTEDEVEASFEELIKKKSSYSWIKEEEQVDHHYVITGTKDDQDSGIRERIVVTAYQYAGEFELTLSHELSGDEENLQLIEKYNLENTDNQEVFYTIRGTVAKDRSGLLKQANEWVKGFEANEIEGLYESDFVSLSLITDKFDGTVTTSDNKKMNLQIGLRTTEDSDDVDVTIGSPIITTEY